MSTTDAAPDAPDAPDAPELDRPDPVADVADDLGPSVTPDFPPVSGLTLSSSRRASPDADADPSPVAPSPIAAPELSVKLLRTSIANADAGISYLLGVPPEEDPDVIKGTADAIYPLAQFYAQQAPTLATLKWAAVVGLMGWAGSKIAAVRLMYQERKAEQHGSEEEEG